MSIINRILCKMWGHNSSPPIIEAWASKQGKKQTAYLCRRCLTKLGEKYYERA